MNKPQAHLMVKGSRVKLYENKYYLQNNTEFELELYNPTQFTVCAQISINGKDEPNGLVVQPGQRYSIDRFIANNNKMKFETYEVESGNTEVNNAILKNGHIQVSFYNEKVIRLNNINSWTTTTTTKKHYPNDNVYSRSINNQYKQNIKSNYLSDSGLSNISSLFSNSMNDMSDETYINRSSEELSRSFVSELPRNVDLENTKTKTLNIETGRIQEGSVSDQTFEKVDKQFEYFSTEIIKFQILPLSAKPEEQEIAMYCCSCGRKARKNEKFCPKCGNDLVLQRKML